MTEQDPKLKQLEALPLQGQIIGNIALSGAKESAAATKLFGIEQRDFDELAVGAGTVAQEMKRYVNAVDGVGEDGSAAHDGFKTTKILTPRNPQVSASKKARVSYAGLKVLTGMARQIVVDGARFINTHKDIEKGAEHGRTILPETHEVDILQDIYEGRIVPSAKALRKLRDTTWDCAMNLAERLNGEDEEIVSSRYTLLKAVATETIPDESDLSTAEKLKKMSLGIPLAAMTFPKNIPKEVVREAQSGAFDSRIALDILQFAGNNPERQSDLDKIGQMIPHIKAYNETLGVELGQDEVYKLLASTVDNWPAAQRQIVLEERNKLIDRFSGNLLRLFNVLDEAGFLSPDSSKTRSLFTDSVSEYFMEITRRAPVTRENRVTVVAAKNEIGANRKRKKSGGTTKRNRTRAINEDRVRGKRLSELQALWGQEAEPDPLNLVTFDPETGTFVEEVGGLVEEYIEGLSQRGNQELRRDIDSMVSYLQVPDRPLDQPDGVKHIKNPARIIINGKNYRLFEFKPTEASGLPLHDDFARQLRIYFCPLDSKTRCIIKVLPHSAHEEFLGNLSRAQKPLRRSLQKPVL